MCEAVDLFMFAFLRRAKQWFLSITAGNIVDNVSLSIMLLLLLLSSPRV